MFKRLLTAKRLIDKAVYTASVKIKALFSVKHLD